MAEKIDSEQHVKSSKEDRIVNYWLSLKTKPKCIVFDLDYTIWPFIIDSFVLPPFYVKASEADKEIYDHRKRRILLYEDTSLIVRTLREKCFPLDDNEKRYLAIASRSSALDEALELLRLNDLLDYFDSVQIYSGTKLKHMKNIKRELKLDSFKEMLFFDDNKSNLAQTESLGLVGYQVHRHFGLGLDELLEGFRKYNLTSSKLYK